MKKSFLLFFIILFTNLCFSQNSAENLGNQINSKNSEIRPVLSFDGKTLYFVVENSFNNKNNRNNNPEQEIWYSELNSDGTWSQAVKSSAPFNSQKVDNAIFWTSFDGSKLFILL